MCTFYSSLFLNEITVSDVHINAEQKGLKSLKKKTKIKKK